MKAKRKYSKFKTENNANKESSGIVICGQCKRVFDNNYSFKHSEISHKEFSAIIDNIFKNREALFKLIAMIVFVEKGNSLVIKSINGRNNTGIYLSEKASELLDKINKEHNIKTVMNLTDWINSIGNSELLALISVELFDIGTLNGYLNKLGDE